MTKDEKKKVIKTLLEELAKATDEAAMIILKSRIISEIGLSGFNSAQIRMVSSSLIEINKAMSNYINAKLTGHGKEDAKFDMGYMVISIFALVDIAYQN